MHDRMHTRITYCYHFHMIVLPILSKNYYISVLYFKQPMSGTLDQLRNLARVPRTNVQRLMHLKRSLLIAWYSHHLRPTLHLINERAFTAPPTMCVLDHGLLKAVYHTWLILKQQKVSMSRISYKPLAEVMHHTKVSQASFRS